MQYKLVQKVVLVQSAFWVRAVFVYSKCLLRFSVCSGLSAGLCSCLVMILFASEVKLHHLSERIANFNEVNFIFQTHSERYDRSFWLFMLIFLLHGLNILLIRLAGIQFPFQDGKEAELSGGAADLMY